MSAHKGDSSISIFGLVFWLIGHNFMRQNKNLIKMKFKRIFRK